MSSNGWDVRKLRSEQGSLDRMLTWSRAQRVQALINLTEASAECDHGALPLDRKKPDDCNCWTVEATNALAHRQQENPDFSDAA